MNAVSDPDISVDELVKVLLISPSLTARLLGLANSAYFGYSGQINDLRKAIIQVLGLNLVKSLALSIVLNVKLDSAKCPSFNTLDHWRHALTTAVVAQKMSVKCASKEALFNPSVIYTSGLLLNIGIMAAVFLFPEQMEGVFRRCGKSRCGVYEEITRAVGYGHYHIGYMLLHKWKLPVVHQTVQKEFQNQNYQGEEAELLSLLGLSHAISTHFIEGRTLEIDGYQTNMQRLGLTKEDLQAIIAHIEERKDDIWELAAVVDG